MKSSLWVLIRSACKPALSLPNRKAIFLGDLHNNFLDKTGLDSGSATRLLESRSPLGIVLPHAVDGDTSHQQYRPLQSGAICVRPPQINRTRRAHWVRLL